jgi:hypothetical protein
MTNEYDDLDEAFGVGPEADDDQEPEVEDDREAVRAEYGSHDHPLKIAGMEIPCYVLEDGRRVLVRGAILKALNMSTGSAHGGIEGDRLVKFVFTKGIKPYVSDELIQALTNPILIRTPHGVLAHAAEATILADLCDAVLEAREKGDIHRQQIHIAKQCEILVRGFARVGIIALVDEATGYQEVRNREALQALLDKYLLKEFAAWARRFPPEFYHEMFRLKGWQWRGLKVGRSPGVVGKYTNDIVYERLAPGLLEELQARNPKNEKGYRDHKHHQLLTEDVGHPALAQHLYAVIGLMRASSNWDQFYRMMQRAFPKRSTSLLLPLFGDQEQ